MSIVAQPQTLARKHFAIGYELYVAGQRLSTCQNAMQIAGWHNAQTGHMASVDAETAVYLDEAAELEEYREWIADQDYHRSGNW